MRGFGMAFVDTNAMTVNNEHTNTLTLSNDC